jgi:hypothetical protein
VRSARAADSAARKSEAKRPSPYFVKKRVNPRRTSSTFTFLPSRKR